MQSRWYDFGGDTVVRTDQYIRYGTFNSCMAGEHSFLTDIHRLTGELPSRAGWLFSKVPLTATNWELEIEYKISGTGTLYGDGMAIWLTKQRSAGGPVFGFIDKFDGLGIFIDTYKNDRPGVVFPYVMAMIGDGQTTYDKAHDGKANELGGCPVSCISRTIPLEYTDTCLHPGSQCSQQRISHENQTHLYPR
jgi:mannose-binding lectin 2